MAQRCGKNGLCDIQELGFYSGFDWSKVLESTDSPLIPLSDKGMEVSESTHSSQISEGRYSFSELSK